MKQVQWDKADEPHNDDLGRRVEARLKKDGTSNMVYGKKRAPKTLFALRMLMGYMEG